MNAFYFNYFFSFEMTTLENLKQIDTWRISFIDQKQLLKTENNCPIMYIYNRSNERYVFMKKIRLYATELVCNLFFSPNS